MDVAAEGRKLEKAKRLRRGKKTAITKRIAKLLGMVQAGGCSRRQMRFLLNKLLQVFDDLEKVCEQVSDISILLSIPEDEHNDLADVSLSVDECTGVVNEHIDSRQDEESSSSSGSITASWVSSHAEIMGQVPVDDHRKEVGRPLCPVRE